MKGGADEFTGPATIAFVSVNLQAEQGISGIGFYLFGLGMSDLLFQKLVGTVGFTFNLSESLRI